MYPLISLIILTFLIGLAEQHIPISISSSPSRLLKISSIAPLSGTGFPCEIDTALFAQDCIWQCSYCDNTHLCFLTQDSSIAWMQVLNFSYCHTEWIDAVVFIGSEPTIDPALIKAM